MDIVSVAETIKVLSAQYAHTILIGIEGFGGSGKTTISKHLSQSLGDAHVIHIDDFIVKEKLLEPAWDTGVFDHGRLEKQVLQPAKSGKPIIYQPLIYDENRLGQPTALPPVQFVIVEGISCYITFLRPYYDIKIWVDTSIEIAMSRGIARDGTHGNSKDWKRWAKIDVSYLQKYQPNLVADYIVTNP